MTRDEARQEILVRVSALDYLQKSERGEYICPFCNSGTGANKTGAMHYYKDTNTVACFGRCALDNGKKGRKYDVIDLHRQYTGTDYNTAISDLARQIGITIDPYIPEPDYTRPQKIKPAGSPTTDFSGQGKANTLPAENASTEAQKAPQEVQYMQEVQKDYTEYYRECKARINDPAAAEYLAFRGISPEVAHRFWLGFDPAWRSPAAIERGKNPPSSPRLIIPTSSSSYIARDTRQDAESFTKMKEGEVHLFNTRDLYNADDRPVFITEGEIDAISVIEAGGLATALGSTNNWKSLVDLLREKRTNNTLVLCLDNDDAGKKATRDLAEALQGLNISFIRADIAAGYKDPNEALTADREAFTRAIRAAERQTAAKPDSMADYISRAFNEDVERFKTASIRKTGLPNLDKVAGGIYPGLYVMGAISALGKTTLIHQIADQMAGAGEHVLFFSLEQSRFEMASKSLARITAYRNIRSAVSSLDIRKGNITLAVQEAQKVYAKMIAPRMSIIEGNFNCNISFIGDYVARYIKKNGRKPVVIVDYLQILDGMADQRQTTRDLVDTNVRELKRMSRNYDIPVIVISSLNRTNYLAPVDFESFKESGGIEYTADVVWGLQLDVMNDPLFDKDRHIKEKHEMVRNAKKENPRKIQLLCLKNRYGISSYTADFLYYPANDYFKPAGQEYANWQPTYPNAEEVARELEADLEAMYRDMIL